MQAKQIFKVFISSAEKPNIVVEWLKLLLPIREIPGSNLERPAILTEVVRSFP
jgi:hypothetical protein